ncbi:Hypothetical protein GbCGDNIH6_0325 [Granulibacter bethesdensis]|uniref:retroviral-like aspartic protease family protein n=1 Tax=Granulibacter bethesdensis TaxID=364410 RepID=UPI00090BAEEC|nr:retroviral-like aspartic protease family protein [Granulibacter bethesdensis]APH56120.1 Hypothetical protein GbCGDNIH6_0325 [Granulibacter bethesdensis]
MWSHTLRYTAQSLIRSLLKAIGMRRGGWWWLPLLLSACDASAGSRCELTRHAHLTLIPYGHLFAVPVIIDDQPATMIVDTGAAATVIAVNAIQKLHLAPDPTQSSIIQGIGGLYSHANVQLHTLQLGQASIHDISLAVAGVPEIEGTASPAVGLLGLDILGQYDIALDIPHRTLDLYDSEACSGAFLPWKGQYAALPLHTDWRNALVRLPVYVDNTSLTAILDSGASISVITLASTHKAGETLHPDDVLNHGSGMDMHPVSIYRHAFDRLTVGREEFLNQPIAVGDITLPGGDMLLGTDYLATRRVWISFMHKAIFVQQQESKK